MGPSQVSALAHYVRRLGAEATDRELLRRYASDRDEAAFASLVERHGPLVWGVCRRALGQQDGEDVFQATFLVLARKAAVGPWQESVGPWLHAVATRLARKARCRGPAFVPLAEVASAGPAPPEQAMARELLAALDEELATLPEKYRGPLVLCDLQDQTQEQAAHLLRTSLSSVRRHLEVGRARLRTRLTRRGLSLSAACAAAQTPASAAPAVLTGAPSARVLALLRAPARRSAVLAVLLVLGAALAGVGLVARRPAAAPPPSPREAAAAAAVRLGRPVLVHQDNVHCAAFSPDGTILATGGFDAHVRLWDATSGQQLRALRHRGGVRSLAWAPDGKTLISASDGEGIRVWAATGKELRRLGERKGTVTSLALTADGKTLAYAIDSHTVVVRDVASDRELFRVEAHARAYRLAFAPDGQTLVVGGEQKKVRRWQVPAGKELPPLEGHRGSTYPVAFSPDGLLIASGGSYADGHIHLWDATTGKEVRRWLAHTYGVGALAFSPDGKTLLSGHNSIRDTLRLWDVDTGRALRSFPAPSHGLVDVIAFAPDGKRAASAGCWGRGVYLWDVASGEEVSPFPRHHDAVTAVAFAPDGKHLVTGSADHTVGVWQTSTGRLARRFREHQGPVHAVAVSPDGKLVASAGKNEKVVRLWSRATGELVRELLGERLAFASLAFSPDGRSLAAGLGEGNLRVAGARAADGAVHLWEVATGKEARQFHGKGGGVNALAFSPDGRFLATAGRDEDVIHLWDRHAGKETRLVYTTPSGASKWLGEGTLALAFAPDGRTLAAVSIYGQRSNIGPAVPPKEKDVRTIALWEMATKTVRHEARLPLNRVTAAAFVDDRHLVLGDRDGALRVLDLAIDTWLPSVPGHTGAVTSLALSPDGRAMASGSLDTTALVRPTERVVPSRPLKQTKRTGRELEALRRALLGEDAARAYRAVWELAGTGQAVALLAPLVRPVPPADEARLRALIAELDSDDFEVREKATLELAGLKEVAGPGLRTALRQPVSPEVRRRVRGLLARLGEDEDRGAARALEVLERLGTAEARGLVEKAAAGAPEARLTQAARAALRRLGRGGE